MIGRQVRALTVYAAGVLQGFAFVLIPALGNLLEGPHYGLSHSAYGSLFLPITAGAILGAILAGPLNASLGSRGVFRIGLAANALAVIVLAGSNGVAGQLAAYVMLLAETGLLGVGFGLNLAAVNHFAAAMYPENETAAITILNGLIGASTTISPLVLHVFESRGYWWLWPLVLGTGFLAVLGASATLASEHRLPLTAESRGTTRALRVFAAAVFVYAVCEGTFGSWAEVYVTVTRGHSAQVGADALAIFWGTMTIFRVVAGLLPAAYARPRQLYVAAPIGIAICFLALPLARNTWLLIALFGAAGIACSIYYPYSMSFALQIHSREQTRVAGFLVAALMAGEGFGSYVMGPLQSWIPLTQLYGFASLWAIVLFALSWSLRSYIRHGALIRSSFKPHNI